LQDNYEKWRLFGDSFIKTIASQQVYTNVIRSIENYKQLGDQNSVLTYFQHLKIQDNYQWILSHKTFSSDATFLTLAQPLSDFGRFTSIMEDCLGETLIKRDGWEVFQSLSKREKEIMKLLAEGYTSKQISEELYISKFTADTHRRNIFSKLQIKTYSELFKIAQGFEILDMNGQ
jgi:DNA-binding CsgD family transcriptional regulator